MSETPELQANNSSNEEVSDQDPMPPNTKDDLITITSDVVIPEYEPLHVPYSEWETYRSQELLEANGFSNTLDEWRRATQHSSGLIRETAYYLLTRHPEQQNEDLFRRGLDDIDESVQTVSAYGLCILGNKSALPILEKIAQLDVEAHTAAARAAGILAEMGNPSAFATIRKAIDSDLSYVRLFAIKNTMPFVALNGQTYAPGKKIDIWKLYRQAVQDETDQVRSVAKLQLRELNTPEALDLLSP